MAEKKKRGRPSKFTKALIEQARKLCNFGATDEEVADFFKIDVRTLYRWKNENAEFCQALKAGKEMADDRVERSLFQKAVGYRAKAVKIFMPAGAEQPVYADYMEEHSPDTTACIFWLKNRRKEAWRDKQDHELTGKDGKELVPELNVDELARRTAFLLQSSQRRGANGARVNGHAGDTTPAVDPKSRTSN